MPHVPSMGPPPVPGQTTVAMWDPPSLPGWLGGSRAEAAGPPVSTAVWR